MTQLKAISNFLKFKNSIAFLFCCIVLLSCGDKSATDGTETVPETKFDKVNKFIASCKDGKKYRAVLVLSENNCPSCNRSYSKMLTSMLNNPSALIVVSASGTQIDISPFQSDTLKNVCRDVKGEFLRLGVVESSSAIIMGKDKIDTIIDISADGLEQRLEYIQRKMQGI